MQPIAINNNEQRQQFEVTMDGETAFLEYRYHDGKLVLMHTEVPEKLGGRGIATALAAYGFEFAKGKGLLVKIYCPFVLAYFKRHPELSPLITN
ncbi:MAG TPA: GNAT family N-acetyltransferase [Puia sp.]|jgi:predicted GNAT family acetyltransferase|nr:GNAT family N-acetyltransferase [Puia sp.]